MPGTSTLFSSATSHCALSSSASQPQDALLWSRPQQGTFPKQPCIHCIIFPNWASVANEAAVYFCTVLYKTTPSKLVVFAFSSNHHLPFAVLFTSKILFLSTSTSQEPTSTYQMTQRTLLGLAALSVTTAANAASLTLAQNYSGSTLYVTLQPLTTSNLTIFQL